MPDIHNGNWVKLKTSSEQWEWHWHEIDKEFLVTQIIKAFYAVKSSVFSIQMFNDPDKILEEI